MPQLIAEVSEAEAVSAIVPPTVKFLLKYFATYILQVKYVFCKLRAPLLIRAPPSLEEPNAIINGQNRHSFSNNCPIFNPKPPLESWEPQLFPQSIRFDLARAPGALIRQITVCNQRTCISVRDIDITTHIFDTIKNCLTNNWGTP